MSELLTTREVQELLQVDRITVYRMVKDGRLAGIKVGQQWRFPRKELDSLLSGSPEEGHRPMRAGEVLPVHCLQVIQDVFAEILDVGSVTTDTEGEPISEISNSCDFCNLILQSPAGRRGCVASWKRLAQLPAGEPEFMRCHAGLQYARGRIDIHGEQIALLIAGQFYQDAPDEKEETARIADLAARYNLNPEKLQQAAHTIRRLDEENEAQIGAWLIKVAQTFEDIGRERAELLSRLRQIAEMSNLESIQAL
ncbi:MAG: PocR ligand-binding domain-containing protein [Anaerolineales bacterium]|nr:PocR ligand-binding domain-containing protein [Anaerolineales bacterium]